MKEEKALMPFAYVSEATNWKDNNCFKCVHYDSNNSRVEDSEDASCVLSWHIEKAIAYYPLGRININTLRVIGYQDRGFGYAELDRRCRGFYPK